jgi:LysM repeat protein
MSGRAVVAVAVVALLSVGRASAASAEWNGRYTVRPGDSLTAIAQRYDVSLVTLSEANRLDWRKPLLVGVVLRVPATSPARGGWAGSYVVRPGDTLSGIAVRYHVSLTQLAAANEIDPAKVLLIGAHLRVPVGTATIDLADVVQANPYQSGGAGLDVSYPNCALRLPAEHAFTVIGLNGGRPFTTNPCFASEWAAAGPPRSVYLNTAYSPTLGRHITPDCAAAGSRQPSGLALQRAYAIGCSEAEAALAQLGGTMPLALWLDVEPGNSWSSRRVLNVAAISGMLEQLLAQSQHPMIGIYSNVAYWQQIAGGWSSLSVPEWIATGGPDPPGCPTGFAAGPVWLLQSTHGLFDRDIVC